MKKILQKILNNPILAFIIWMALLMTRLIINNNLWGTVVELGGAAIFIVSLINWARTKKTNKSKGAGVLK